MNRNGETALQSWVVALSPPAMEMHVLDVGANVGRWSASMIVAARLAGRADELDLHIFEPASWTFAQLSEAIGSQECASLRQVALSDQSGSSVLHVVGPGAGRNSLERPLQPGAAIETEEIATTTLDEYAGKAGLRYIMMVKIDTEGHDLAVLRGAQKLLAEHRISVVQFEYNSRWIESRTFLNDAFELFESAGYRLGKLTKRGVEFYPCWDTDLETFVEGNYVAAVPDVAIQLPAVEWWKNSRYAKPNGSSS
jgi:FkbM family methyltransferase